MPGEPKVVAITGSSGYIGTRLLQQLEAVGGPGRLVAFDLNPLPFPIHNIRAYQQDVTELDGSLLRRQRVNTLVHLACVNRAALTHRERLQVSARNAAALEGTLKAVQAGRVKHLIYLSSHRVYGAFADNPIPLTEDWPARCLESTPAGFPNLQPDRILTALAEAGANLTITVLRTCPVLGPSADLATGRAFIPFRLPGQGANLPFQILHEDDLVQVLIEFIHREEAGVFNIAGEGVVFLRELAETTHGKLSLGPGFLTRPLASLSRQAAGFPATAVMDLDAARYPIIMSIGKLKQTLGYRFRYTSLDALRSFANSALL